MASGGNRSSLLSWTVSASGSCLHAASGKSVWYRVVTFCPVNHAEMVRLFRHSSTRREPYSTDIDRISAALTRTVGIRCPGNAAAPKFTCSGESLLSSFPFMAPQTRNPIRSRFRSRFSVPGIRWPSPEVFQPVTFPRSPYQSL